LIRKKSLEGLVTPDDKLKAQARNAWITSVDKKQKPKSFFPKALW